MPCGYETASYKKRAQVSLFEANELPYLYLYWPIYEFPWCVTQRQLLPTLVDSNQAEYEIFKEYILWSLVNQRWLSKLRVGWFDVEWADLQLLHDFDVIVERGRIV